MVPNKVLAVVFYNNDGEMKVTFIASLWWCIQRITHLKSTWGSLKVYELVLRCVNLWILVDVVVDVIWKYVFVLSWKDIEYFTDMHTLIGITVIGHGLVKRDLQYESWVSRGLYLLNRRACPVKPPGSSTALYRAILGSIFLHRRKLQRVLPWTTAYLKY